MPVSRAFFPYKKNFFCVGTQKKNLLIWANLYGVSSDLLIWRKLFGFVAQTRAHRPRQTLFFQNRKVKNQLGREILLWKLGFGYWQAESFHTDRDTKGVKSIFRLSNRAFYGKPICGFDRSPYMAKALHDHFGFHRTQIEVGGADVKCRKPSKKKNIAKSLAIWLEPDYRLSFFFKN